MKDTTEKIKTLLAQGSEHEKLDYKSTFDITEQRNLVELAKDIAAMLSSGGGVLLIGADSFGIPTHDLNDELLEKFDETKLRHSLKKYINEPLHVRASAVQIDDHNFILIECDEHPDGFVIFKADGQYTNGGKTKTVFKAGEVFVRHGSASERWQQHDLRRIIDARVSKEKYTWLKEAELILTRVGGVERSTNVDEEKKRLKEVINTLKSKVKSSSLNRSDIRLALDEITLLGIKATHDENEGLFKLCVDSLVTLYGLGFDHKGNWRLTESFNPTALWYEVLIRLPLLGGVCVELKQYKLAKYIVLQRVPGDDGRHYRTLYRHALTMSSRANYVPQGMAGESHSFLSATTNLFRNDVQYKNSLDWDDDEGRTFIVRFDYLAAMITLDAIQKIDTGEFYTSFAFYDKNRVSQMLIDLLLDEGVRKAIFGSETPQLAYIVQRIDEVACRESLYWYKGRWPFSLDQFMSKAEPFKDSSFE